ncbi:hypothetical protein GEMRC1_006123 [Eukaryota sp. GEM-RC1]
MKSRLISDKEEKMASLPDHLVDEEELEERRKDREFLVTYRKRKSGSGIRVGVVLDFCVVGLTILILYMMLKAGL